MIPPSRSPFSKNEKRARTDGRGSIISTLYLDASAFLKLYLPEPESASMSSRIAGRTDVAVSDLTITEAVSAMARRHREGHITLEAASEVYHRVIANLHEGVFQHVELAPAAFREAERLMLTGIPLRAGDSLHLAIAILSEAESIGTFDRQLAAAARTLGLEVLP